MTNTANQNSARNARAIPPRPAKDYDRERRKHLEEHEGSVPRVYTDPAGIPTIGKGHALITKDENGHYTLRKREDIDRDLGGTGNPSSIVTDDDYKRLQDVEGLLNGKAPKPDPKKYGADEAYTKEYNKKKADLESSAASRQTEIEKLIPPYAKQDETPDKNKFKFILKDDRIQAMSDKDWQTARDRVWTLVEAEAKRRGWSDAKIDSYKKEFQGSWEEMMLTSLRFNNVRSPEAIKALLDGDRAKFRAEIEFRSNKETENNEDVRRGLAKRRRDEAEKAAPLKSLGEAERKLWAALVAEHWAYRKRFADLYGLGSPHSVRPGETLDSIAKKHGCTVDELKDLNDIKDLKEKVGKRIFIPTDAYRKEKAARQETAAGLSPEAEKLRAMLGQPLAEPAQEILLKDPALWTENEVRTVMQGEDYQGTNGAAERQEAFNRVAEWFRLTYGDGRARLDVTGRPLPSIPVRQAPREPAPARTPQGENVGDAARSVALRVARAASGDGLESAIRALQGGLNRFVPRQRGTPNLLEDGDYGPKTHLALTRSVAKEGAEATKNAFDLQRMLGASERAAKTASPTEPGKDSGASSATRSAAGTTKGWRARRCKPCSTTSIPGDTRRWTWTTQSARKPPSP
jgi:LysM repeat protein/GH24 family phage-related lysozyme (muramidase)